MKRCIIVLALTLILMVALCGEVLARSTPFGYVNPKWGDGGDDHTWGGENSVGGEPIDPRPGGYASTGFVPFDFLWNSILLRRMDISSGKSNSYTVTGYIIVQPETKGDPQSQVITNNRGN